MNHRVDRAVRGRVKFVLLNPTAKLWRADNGKGPSSKSQMFRFSMLPSLYVAAAMPDWVDTTIVDEDVEPIRYDVNADIIGISFMTFNAPRAYRIADRFRRQGKTVIFGGYHPSFMPDEAAAHCDAICVGEAETTVARMMEDYRRGELKPIYRGCRADLTGLPFPPRDLIRRNNYVLPEVVQATRGCPHACRFCSVSRFFGAEHRTRPVDEVIAEIEGLGRNIMFMDDNLTADRDYALELFHRMIPLKKKWGSQTPITIADDDELLQAAKRSGCQALFVGLESISQSSLTENSKTFLRAKDYARAIDKLHRNDILLMAAVVFGHDSDTKRIFPDTLRFLLDNNVDSIQATILTPFPGTPLFEQMERQGRIFDKDWSHYDFAHAVFDPKHMTPAELKQGVCWVLSEFYSARNIATRTLRMLRYSNLTDGLRLLLMANLGYRHRVRAKGFHHVAAGFSC